MRAMLPSIVGAKRNSVMNLLAKLQSFLKYLNQASPILRDSPLTEINTRRDWGLTRSAADAQRASVSGEKDSMNPADFRERFLDPQGASNGGGTTAAKGLAPGHSPILHVHKAEYQPQNYPPLPEGQPHLGMQIAHAAYQASLRGGQTPQAGRPLPRR